MNSPLIIHDVLTRDECALLAQKLDATSWYDGAKTAGMHGASVKRNEQATEHETEAERRIVANALLRNPLFVAAAMPRDVAVMFSRYKVGASYGSHIDSPLITGPQRVPLRRDVSFTVFLSDPFSYQGGELVIEDNDERPVKLSMGAVVLYPATTLHRVEPVVSGVRVVAVGWVRSLIRDAHKRELVFELDTANAVLFGKLGKTREMDLLQRSVVNLKRMWVDD